MQPSDIEIPKFDTARDIYLHIRRYFSQPDAVIARNGEDGICVYRNENGNKCAAGCCIPDSLYFHMVNSGNKVEEQTVKGLLENNPILDSVFHGGDDLKLYFVTLAQRIHDNEMTENAKDFVKKLDVLALALGITEWNDPLGESRIDFHVSVTSNN